MNRRVLVASVLFVAATVAATPRTAVAQFQKSYHVDVIAEDVFAIVWDDIMSFPAEGNHLVVVGDSDVVVVDANRTPTLADTVIAVVRRRTGKGVSHVLPTTNDTRLRLASDRTGGTEDRRALPRACKHPK